MVIQFLRNRMFLISCIDLMRAPIKSSFASSVKLAAVTPLMLAFTSIVMTVETSKVGNDVGTVVGLLVGNLLGLDVGIDGADVGCADGWHEGNALG